MALVAAEETDIDVAAIADQRTLSASDENRQPEKAAFFDNFFYTPQRLKFTFDEYQATYPPFDLDI